MRSLRPFALSLAAAFVFFGVLNAQDFVFSADGRSAVIEIAALPTPSSIHAADELATYLGRISGARPKTVRGASSARPRVVIGTLDTLGAVPDDIVRKLGAMKSYESSVLSVRGDTLWIVGKEPTAELRGVYRLLEKLGVRWFQAWTPEDPGDYVPARKTVALKPFEEYREPAFSTRNFGQCSSFNEPIPTNGMDVLRRNGFKPMPMFAAPYPHGRESWLKRPDWMFYFASRIAPRDQKMGGGHGTFHDVAPHGKYLKTHPEYFALQGGKRLGKNCQYCISNPALQDLVVSNILARFEKTGGTGSYLFGQADTTYGWCECEGCRALDPPGPAGKGTPNVSTRFQKVVAKMAARVWEKYPKASLSVWAYHTYRELPEGVQLDPRLRVMFCDHGRCQAHRLDDPSCHRNKYYYGLLKGWLNCASDVYTYEYLTDSDWNYSCFERIQAEGLRLYRQLGVTGWYNEARYADAKFCWPSQKQYDEFPSNWQFFYVVGHLLWEPDLDVDALLAEAETLYYGKAAVPMCAYHRYRRELWDARTECAGYPTGNQREPLLLNAPGSKERLLGYLSEADAIAAAAGDKVLRHRLSLDRRWLETYWIKPNDKVRSKASKAFRALRPTSRIVIDGDGSDPAWAGAYYTSDFRSFEGACKPLDARLKTTVGILADEKNFYFLVTALEPATDKMSFPAGRGAWSGDGFEFFLFPPCVENKLFHVAINAKGDVSSESRPSGSFKPAVETKTRVLADRWIVEARIPMDQVYPVNLGDTWKLNLARNRSVRDGITPRGGNFSLEGCGYFNTSEYRPIEIGVPYLVNGSFEDLTPAGMPKGWGSNGKLNKVVKTGAGHAVSVRGDFYQSLERGVLAQKPEPRTFRYSFRAKGPGRLTVHFFRYTDTAAPGTKTGYRRKMHTPHGKGGVYETTGEWEMYTGEYTVPADQWAMLAFQAGGVLIDDVTVTPASGAGGSSK
jgi:hypothetical protein